MDFAGGYIVSLASSFIDVTILENSVNCISFGMCNSHDGKDYPNHLKCLEVDSKICKKRVGNT